MSKIDPDSAEGKLLENLIQTHITEFGLDESPEFVASYIVAMICNHKTNDEITTELTELFGEKFPPGFAEWAYNAMEAVVNGQISEESQNEAVAAVENSKPSVSFTPEQPLKAGGLFARIDKTKANSINSIGKGSGVHKTAKNATRLGKNFSFINAAKTEGILDQIQQDQDMEGNEESNPKEETGEILIRVHNKVRCRHWPNCNMKGCRFGHPTAPCRYGPQCQMAKGTCPYLHEEDIANGYIPKNMRNTFNPFMNNMPMPNMPNMPNMPFPPMPNINMGFHNGQFAPPQPQLSLCKFKEKCANKECKFGHPTPSNPSGTVTDLSWCDDKENCPNVECAKAHPSASLVREPAPISNANYLETCKFGNRCTNSRCKFRHPLSSVICRNGADCTRIDCSFSHPIKETCKFGNNCTNPHCLYQHSQERDDILAQGGPRMTWRRQDGENQSEQQQPETQPAFAAVQNGA